MMESVRGIKDNKPKHIIILDEEGVQWFDSVIPHFENPLVVQVTRPISHLLADKTRTSIPVENSIIQYKAWLEKVRADGVLVYRLKRFQ